LRWSSELDLYNYSTTTNPLFKCKQDAKDYYVRHPPIMAGSSTGLRRMLRHFGGP
jgi:hypothetical protein